MSYLRDINKLLFWGTVKILSMIPCWLLLVGFVFGKTQLEEKVPFLR